MSKTHSLWYSAGTETLRAMGVAVLAYATGIFNAPNYTAAVALSIAALFAALAAGARVLQKFVPALSWYSLVKKVVDAKWAATIAAWMDAFTRAALASFLITITGWLAAPDYSTWHSILVGAVIGALGAGARALQGMITPTELPFATGGNA